MEQIWKHVMLLYVVLVLLFHYHLPQVNSEHQTNSSHTARANTLSMINSTVNRRGGGGGGGHGGGGGGGGHSGGGGGGGGHESSMGMHGVGTIPLYGAAAAGSAHEGNNNHHHGKSNGATLNYVCFYHYILLFLSIAFYWSFPM
ncbi:hypothetical protein Fmac_021880 [Flemingia macrophylla]|uniref:Glycine-rich protein n=1 Tax=Flemingia macrophylla TaxID=520843 RepID=A0ABD1LY41_9FABA